MKSYGGVNLVHSGVVSLRDICVFNVVGFVMAGTLRAEFRRCTCGTWTTALPV